jgi:hypothetical protein
MSKVIYKEAGDKLKYKAAMLGMNIDQVIEQLNNIYEGEVTFCKTTELNWNEEKHEHEDIEGIQVDTIDAPDAVTLVIPDIDNLDYKHLLRYNCRGKISSVTLPKSLERIDLDSLDWLRFINRIFIYESTDIRNSNNRCSSMQKDITLIVKPLDSTKKGRIFNIRV